MGCLGLTSSAKTLLQQIHLNKVEMGFHMDYVHTEFVLLTAIVFEALGPLEQCDSLVALGVLMS